MLVLKASMWGSLALILWTHVGYPVLMALLGRARPRPVRAADVTPPVALVIAAHNEAGVIREKLANALALDYPRDRLRIVVASDGSDDGTDEIVLEHADRGVELRPCPRGGKVNAQNLAVRSLDTDLVAFSDANSLWPPNALRRLVRAFADADVAYACGRLELRSPQGTNQEGAYWRLEIWLRAQESRVGSITAGNGSIYAVRRDAYEEVDTRWGHDLGFPYRMVKKGRRAVYVPDALAVEKMSTDLEDEFRRKVRMFGQSWTVVLHGRMFGLRSLGALYWLQLVSHRLLRYASGLLHLVLLATSTALVVWHRDVGAELLLAAQGLFALLVVGSVLTRGRVRLLAIPHYYLLITWATVVALREAARGVKPVWEKAEGTR